MSLYLAEIQLDGSPDKQEQIMQRVEDVIKNGGTPRQS